MYKVFEVSNKTLRKDVKKYKKLCRSSFSMSVYIKKEEIEVRSESILESFLSNDLVLQPNQYVLFARYINQFANANADKCFEKLQKMADFDVRESIQDKETGLWQKLLKYKNNRFKYLSTAKLEKQINEYKKNQDIIETSLAGYDLHDKNEKIRQKGQDYIKAYVDGKIDIKQEDLEIFEEYIKVMNQPIYEDSLGDRALKKLSADREKYEKNEEVKESRKKSWFSGIKHKLDKGLVSLKEKSPLYAKIAAGVTIVATSVVLLISKYSNNNNISTLDKSINTTETKAPVKVKTAQTKDKDTTLIYHWQPVSTNEMKDFSKKVESKTTVESKEVKKTPVEVKEIKKTPVKAKEVKKVSVEIKETKIDSKRQAIINHHDHVLAMRIGAKQRDNNYEQIKGQIEKGIITLPDSIGKEEFAYAMEMYQAYGVESSLPEAFNAKQKLSAEANKKIAEEIAAAGDTGLGVKKMAEKKYNGKMNHNSVYDRASVKSQKKHNMNMKQLRQARKAAARSA